MGRGLGVGGRPAKTRAVRRSIAATATAIQHDRAVLRFGTVTHADRVAPVPARLTALGG